MQFNTMAYTMTMQDNVVGNFSLPNSELQIIFTFCCTVILKLGFTKFLGDLDSWRAVMFSCVVPDHYITSYSEKIVQSVE